MRRSVWFGFRSYDVAGSDLARRQTRLAVEPLEQRAMLAVLTVDIGDPTANDPGDNLYAEIQEAVDAASAGDTILVHAGTYHPFVVDKDFLTIREANAHSDPVVDGDLNSGDENCIEIYASGVTIQGLTAQNASGEFFGGTGDGFRVIGHNATLIGNAAINNARSGFDTILFNFTIPNSSPTSDSFPLFFATDNSTFIDNTASGNADSGFYIGGTNNMLTGNTASDNGSGFRLQYGYDQTLIGNTSSGNEFNGFYASGDGGNRFRRNTASENGSNGFYVAGSDNNTLKGNTARDNGSDGFILLNSSHNTLQSNTASGNAGNGFVLSVLPPSSPIPIPFPFPISPSTDNTLIGNTASDNGNWGFVLESSHSNTLSRNTASGNEDGFRLQGDDNTVRRNTASENGLTGFDVSGNGNTLMGNTATDIMGYGFVVRGNDNTLKGNTASGNLSGFVIVGDSFTVGHNTLMGNKATANLSHGFFLTNANGNTLKNNTSSGNGGDGFYLTAGFVLSGSNDNTITCNTAIGNLGVGFNVVCGDYNALRNNRAVGNAADGFQLENSSNNTLERNWAIGNEGNGFVLDNDSNNNVFNGNQARFNDGYGFLVDAVMANLFEDNVCMLNALGGSNQPDIC